VHQLRRFGFGDDNAPVAADPHQSEVSVPGLVELLEAHAGVGRVQWQVEGRGFHGFLK
jgi:hypothetical protein